MYCFVQLLGEPSSQVSVFFRRDKMEGGSWSKIMHSTVVVLLQYLVDNAFGVCAIL